MAEDHRRRTYVERSAGADGGAVIVGRDDPEDVFGVRVTVNPLRDGWPIAGGGPGSWILGWSGSMGDGLFEPHPHTWLSAGHEALAARCDEAVPRLEAAGRRLCLQPHHRHVLSDAPSCWSFVEARRDGPIGVALSPATMLTPEMTADAGDHLERMFSMLGDRCSLVILTDPDGVLPADLVATLLERHVPPRIPVVEESPMRGGGSNPPRSDQD